MDNNENNTNPLKMDHAAISMKLNAGANLGITMVSAGVVKSDFVFPHASGGELLRITPTAFIFKNVEIEDAGEAYRAFMEVMNGKRDLHSFMFAGEWPSYKVADMPEKMEFSLIPGTVLIRMNREGLEASHATRKVIKATIEEVRKYFLQNTVPVQYSDKELADIRVVNNLGGRYGTGYVAIVNGHVSCYLSGPVTD